MNGKISNVIEDIMGFLDCGDIAKGLEGRVGVEFWFRMGKSMGIRVELILTAECPTWSYSSD